MNRIRETDEGYEILLTPNLKYSPDSSLMIGNMEDAELRNFEVVKVDHLLDAQNVAFGQPDIDWNKIILNHTHIYDRLRKLLKEIVDEQDINVQLIPHLMSPMELKNTMMDRVKIGGDRFNLRYGANDIISFVITNSWTDNLRKLAKFIIGNKQHFWRDDVRIRDSFVVDGKIIVLHGVTEFGSMYEIKLMPTLIYDWYKWHQKVGFKKPEASDRYYRKMIKKQDSIDSGPVLR